MYGNDAVSGFIVTRHLMKVLLQTSSATMWALYSLANNPEAQEKLYEETKRVLPNNETITPEKLPELQYVRAVMKETFRHVIYLFLESLRSIFYHHCLHLSSLFIHTFLKTCYLGN